MGGRDLSPFVARFLAHFWFHRRTTMITQQMATMMTQLQQGHVISVPRHQNASITNESLTTHTTRTPPSKPSGVSPQHKKARSTPPDLTNPQVLFPSEDDPPPNTNPFYSLQHVENLPPDPNKQL